MSDSDQSVINSSKNENVCNVTTQQDQSGHDNNNDVNEDQQLQPTTVVFDYLMIKKQKQLVIKLPSEEQQKTRSEGLGPYFSKLPDFLVLRIVMHYLVRLGSVHDIINLGLVSKAFYQFCEWDRIYRWLTVNLTEGNFEYDTNWKNTFVNAYALKQWESRCIQEGKVLPKPEPIKISTEPVTRGFYSPYMYMHCLRANANLFLHAVDHMRIPRETRMTAEEFNIKYDKPCRPVILSDVCSFWPAMNLWSPDCLAERFGDVMLKCAQYNHERKRIKMTVSQYVKYMREQRDYSPLYVFDPGFGERIPQLLEEYTIPKQFWMDYFSVFGNHRPAYRWLVMGPERSGSSFHIDPNGTSAWNALLHGRKRWALYPPHYTPPGIDVDIDEDGCINAFKSPNPMKWFFEILPHLAPHQKPIEITQNAGEMVFIPAGWWHAVLNLEETVSVTQNFVNDNNLNLAVEFLYNQDMHQMLENFQFRLREIRPDAYKRVKTKLRLIKGKEAVSKIADLEEEKNKWQNEKEDLLREISELKKKLSESI